MASSGTTEIGSKVSGCLAYGAGILLGNNGLKQLKNCVIRGNMTATNCGSSSYGGGVYSETGELVLENCIVAANESTNSGSGVWVASGTALIKNSTIYKNAFTGIHRAGGTVTILNSILFCNYNACNNPTGGIQLDGFASNATYSCIQGGYAGNGNHAYHPNFENETTLRIASGSPCIDAGNPDPQYNDGARPPALGDPQNDMGAHGGPGGDDWDLPFDCNDNFVLDREDIAEQRSRDCNANGIPDECDIQSGAAVDANGDGLIDECLGRSICLVPVPSATGFKYVVVVRSDVPFLGGEFAIGFDKRVLDVVGFRELRPDLPASAVVEKGPTDPVAGTLLTCTGTDTAGFIVGFRHPETPLGPGTFRLFEFDVDFLPNSPANLDSRIDFVSCLGTGTAPRITNVLTDLNGRSLPLYGCSEILRREDFVRGDTNNDGRFDISDPIWLLRLLFLTTEDELRCPDAADADDSGSLQVTDAVHLLNWRFRGGPGPLPPYPVCGLDPTDDSLGPCSSRCP